VVAQLARYGERTHAELVHVAERHAREGVTRFALLMGDLPQRGDQRPCRLHEIGGERPERQAHGSQGRPSRMRPGPSPAG
jgi:hypothetical protein